jgi:Domain of unknown function (DUF4349)
MMRFVPIVGIAFLLASCGSQPASLSETENLRVKDVSEAAAGAKAAGDVTQDAAGKEAENPVPAAAPQIAYSYTYGYRLSEDDIGAVQQKHIALCDKLGAARCRVVSMKRAANDGEFVEASLSLQVDAKIARSFGQTLDKAVSDTGGETSSRDIEAEDLSKQMVDTAARIRAKEALTDRLLLLLKNRTGKVGELVEAERAFADAQEELDAARTWMAEMQQRVALSKIEISYNGRSPSGGGLWQPVRDSLAAAGQILGSSIGVLIGFILAVLPWLLLLSGLIWLSRRFGWFRNIRLRRPRTTNDEQTKA